MKRSASMILMLAMVLCLFAGCGNQEADALVGTWAADVDMTQMVSEAMSAEMAEYVALNDVIFTMRMQFNDDGTFSVSLDKTSVETALEGVLQSVKDGVYAMLEAQIAQTGLEMTVEEMLAASGMDLDAIIADLETQMNLSGLAEQINTDASGNGQYDAKGGKLFLSAGLEYRPDPACYEVYTLDGEVLTLLEYVGDDAGSFDGLYPLQFHKVA